MLINKAQPIKYAFRAALKPQTTGGAQRGNAWKCFINLTHKLERNNRQYNATCRACFAAGQHVYKQGLDSRITCSDVGMTVAYCSCCLSMVDMAIAALEAISQTLLSSSTLALRWRSLFFHTPQPFSVKP